MAIIERPFYFSRRGTKIEFSVNTKFPFSIKREVKHRYERARYGVSYADVWNLDGYLAEVMCRGLDELQKVDGGCPTTINSKTGEYLTHEEWKEILIEMRDGFCFYAEHKYDSPPLDEYIQLQHELKKRSTRSFTLMRKWFGGLWW